jgi:hypothetical protein
MKRRSLSSRWRMAWEWGGGGKSWIYRERPLVPGGGHPPSGTKGWCQSLHQSSRSMRPYQSRIKGGGSHTPFGPCRRNPFSVGSKVESGLKGCTKSSSSTCAFYTNKHGIPCRNYRSEIRDKDRGSYKSGFRLEWLQTSQQMVLPEL